MWVKLCYPYKVNGLKRCRWSPKKIPDMDFITRHEIEKLTCGPVNGAQANPNKPTQPNILFILSDDQGYHDVGYQGSEILTPNIDQLAEEGVKLENYYITQGNFWTY